MLSATITLFTENADAIYGAISPEAGREIPRTKVSAARYDNQVALHIEATDMAALRAALNSYLRWIKIVEDMNKMVGE